MTDVSAKRPNVLLIVTDQHRADHVGFGGNDIVQTPNLDALAARSVVFDRAYVANPICMPNRSSIMTSLVPSAHGTRYNGIPLDWGFTTFVRVARDAGYRTALVGKSHLQNMNDAPEVVRQLFKDAPRRDARPAPWPDGWDAYELADRHREERVEVPEDFYGFDRIAFTVQHSDYASGHYYQWLRDQGADPSAIQGAGVALDYNATTQQVWKTRTPPELYPTTYVTEKTIEFLEAQEGADAPFLIQCSFPDPHHPFTPPGDYFDMYDPDAIPLPDTFWETHETSPPGFKKMVENRGDPAFFMAPFSPTEAQFREMAAKQYGMISMIDDGVGRVLKTLERIGKADDTIVVFTSDHGDMFGDHGLMLKAGMHYEGTTRVPLTIAAPGKGAGRRAAFAGSLDIGPTLLDLMGLDGFYGMQGKSLLPLIDDEAAPVRDSVYIEEEQMFPDPDTGRQINLRTLVTGEGRITVRNRRPLLGELFDHAIDRGETRNVYDDARAADLKHHLIDRLTEEMMQHSTPLQKPAAMA